MLIELIRVVLGIVLAVVFGRDQTVSLAAGLAAGLLGGTSIISYFVCSGLLQTGGQMLNRDRFDFPVTEVDVFKVMKLKAFYLVFGLVAACGFSIIGWSGLGSLPPMIIAACTLLFRFGAHTYFWLLVVLSGLLLWVGYWLQMPNMALVILILIKGLKPVVELTLTNELDDPELEVTNGSFDVPTFALGIGVGLIPAIGAGLYASKTSTLWIATAIGEGVGLGVMLLIKTGGRTPVAQVLHEFAPNINPIYAIVAVGITLWFSLLPGTVKIGCTPSTIPKWLKTVTVVLALTYFGGIPGQPALSIVISMLLVGGCQLAKRLPPVLPPKYELGLACLPTLAL